MREVVLAVNRCSEKPTAEDVVGRRFDPLWATFDDNLKKVPAQETSEKSKRTQSQVLEDLVSTVRSLEMRFRELTMMSDDPFRSNRRRRYHPKMFFEMIEISGGEGSSSIMLPMFAGMFRDEAPWISEILMEASRDLSEPTKSRRLSGQRKLRDLLRMVEKGHPMFREMMDSKETYVLLREMSHLIEREMENFSLSSNDVISNSRLQD